jgi:hypothetical protein
MPDGGKWTVDDIITKGLIVGRGVAHGEGGFCGRGSTSSLE